LPELVPIHLMRPSFIRSFYEGEEAKKNPGGWTPGLFLFGSRVLLGEVVQEPYSKAQLGFPVRCLFGYQC
jgi:hypothetical protein